MTRIREEEVSVCVSVQCTVLLCHLNACLCVSVTLTVCVSVCMSREVSQCQGYHIKSRLPEWQFSTWLGEALFSGVEYSLWGGWINLTCSPFGSWPGGSASTAETTSSSSALSMSGSAEIQSHSFLYTKIFIKTYLTFFNLPRPTAATATATA